MLPADPVRVGLNGCLRVSNGELFRTAESPLGQKLLHRLLTLVDPKRTAAAPRCIRSQLGLTVQTQAETGTAWIGVTLRNRGRTCELTGTSVTVTLEQHGAAAHVQGNPLRLEARGPVGRGDGTLLIVDWSNWCGFRRAITLLARLGETNVRTRFDFLPRCDQPQQHSRLVFVQTVAVGASAHP